MIALQKLQSLLSIKREEISSALFLFSLFFFSSFGACIGLNACDSLFLNQYGVKGLPFAFLFTALFTMITALHINFFLRKLKLPLFTSSLFLVIFLIITCCAVVVLLFPTIKIVYLLLFIFAYSFFALQKTVLFNIFQWVYDIRQTKRLFPLITSGAVLGLAGGGFSTIKILSLLPNIKYLILCWGAFTFITYIMVYFFFKQHSHNETPQEQDQSTDFIKNIINNIKYLKESKLFLYLSLMSVITFALILHFDFLYMLKIKMHYKNPKEVTEVFGLVRGVSTLVIFFLQIFLTGPLIRFFGITNTVLVFPIFMSLSFLYVRLQFNILSIFSGRYAYYISKESLHMTSFQPIMHALKEKIRQNAPFFINNIMGSIGQLIAASYLIVFLQKEFFRKNSTELAIVLSFVLIGLAFKVRKYYVKELIENINEQSPKQLDLIASLKQLKDHNAVNYMIDVLKGTDVILITFVLESLKSIDSKKPIPIILDLLKRFEDDEVISGVFEYFKHHDNNELLKNAKNILTHNKSNITLYFLDYITHLKVNIFSSQNIEKKSLSPIQQKQNENTSLLRELLIQFSQEKNVQIAIRANALLYLKSKDLSPENETNKNYQLSILSMLNQPNDSIANKLIIIQELANYKLHFFGEACLELRDLFLTDPTLKIAYLCSILKFSDEKVIQFLFRECYKEKSVRAIIQKKLINISEESHLLLLNEQILIFCNDSEFRFMRNHLIGLLLQLKKLNHQAKIYLIDTLAALREFDHLKFQIAEFIPHLSIDVSEDSKNKILQMIEEELISIEKLCYYENELSSLKKKYSNILSDEINHLKKKKENLVLDLLHFLFKDQNISSSIYGVRSPLKRIKNTAMETMEQMIPKKIKEKLFQILDRDYKVLLYKSKIDFSQIKPMDLLIQMTRSDSPWLKALGIYLSKEENDPGIKTHILELKSEYPLIEELKQQYLEKIDSH